MGREARVKKDRVVKGTGYPCPSCGTFSKVGPKWVCNECKAEVSVIEEIVQATSDELKGRKD